MRTCHEVRAADVQQAQLAQRRQRLQRAVVEGRARVCAQLAQMAAMLRQLGIPGRRDRQAPGSARLGVNALSA
jgi:hypothetical protein